MYSQFMMHGQKNIKFIRPSRDTQAHIKGTMEAFPPKQSSRGLKLPLTFTWCR